MRGDALVGCDDGLWRIPEQNGPFLQHRSPCCIAGEKTGYSLAHHDFWSTAGPNIDQPADQENSAAGSDSCWSFTERWQRGVIIHKQDEGIRVSRHRSRRLI